MCVGRNGAGVAWHRGRYITREGDNGAAMLGAGGSITLTGDDNIAGGVGEGGSITLAGAIRLDNTGAELAGGETRPEGAGGNEVEAVSVKLSRIAYDGGRWVSGG